MLWLLLKRENQISKAANTTIENFSESHLEEVFAIEEYSNLTPWRIQTFQKVLENRTLSFVIKSNSKIIGFCIASAVHDECHLQNICVAKEFKRQGLGKSMLKTLTARCQVANLKQVILEVRESNSAAQNFYKQCGFCEIGQRKNYYKLGDGRRMQFLCAYLLKSNFYRKVFKLIIFNKTIVTAISGKQNF